MSPPSTPPRPTDRSLRSAKIVAIVVVVAALVVAQRLGVFEEFADPSRVKQTLVSLGPWGYFAFVSAYAAFQPFGLPGTVFILAAPLIWPWPVAYALSMTGTMCATVVGFTFCRFVARDWISARLPARLRRYDEALARRAFRTVFILRFIFWMPPSLHAFFGLSKVSFGTHFWASFLAYLLPLFLVSFFGQKLVDVLRNTPAHVWLGVFVVAAFVVLVGWLVRRGRAPVGKAQGR